MQADVYLLGYYGMRNQGDNALMHAAYWGVEHFLSAQRINISTPSPIDSLQIHNDATLVTEQRFRGHNRILHYLHGLQSKQIVIGGGSVFHSAQDIDIKRHLNALCQQHQTRAVGVSLGPFANIEAEKACQKFLNTASFVGVRDMQSLQIANDIAPTANVKLTFDLAPLLLKSEHFQTVNTKAIRNGIAVCLNPVERLKGDIKTENARLDTIAAALIELYRQTAEPVVFIDFNGHETFGDAAVHLHVMNKLFGKVPFEYYAYHDNPFSTLEILASVKGCLAMRLHASVFSYLVETPFLSLNYHKKCQGWCDQVGQTAELTMTLEQIEVDQLTKQLVRLISHQCDVPALNRRDAVTLALSNWSDEYDIH